MRPLEVTQTIVPLGKIVRLGFRVNWEGDSFELWDASGKKIEVILEAGCPTVELSLAHQLIEQLENHEAEMSGAGKSRQHRKVPHPDAMTLSLDVCGPFRPGEDYRKKARYFLVGVKLCLRRRIKKKLKRRINYFLKSKKKKWKSGRAIRKDWKNGSAWRWKPRRCSSRTTLWWRL